MINQNIVKQKFGGEKGYASLLRQKRSRKPAFVAVKAQLTQRETKLQPTASGQPASLACCAARRTAKNRWTDQKMNAFIFWLATGFSYARKLSLRRSSYRRKLFVVVFKPDRLLRSRRRSLLAQRFGGRGGLQRLPSPISVYRRISSIRRSTPSVRGGAFRTARLSMSCSGRLAPMRAEVTTSSRSTHCRAR